MKNVLVALGLALACSSAAAQQIFFDDFDDETWGLNKAPSGWTVTNGTVDIIGAGSPHDLRPGNGLYIDLDGSSNDAGLLSTALSFAAGTLYELSFDVAGSWRPDGNNTMTYGIDFDAMAALDVLLPITLPAQQDFTRLSLLFSTPVATTGRIVFDHIGNDNMGLLLDDVRVAAIPEPGTWGLMLAGLGLLGFAARRRMAGNSFKNSAVRESAAKRE